MSCPFGKEPEAQDSNGSQDGSSGTSDLNYSTYLRLDKILEAQTPLTWSASNETKRIHDEHLFIITHQAFELWFKQILLEIDSIIHIFMGVVDEKESLTIVNRLQRTSSVVKLIGGQFEILETMTPLDFLDFRIVLEKASGFQSAQFRLLENKLGVLSSNRTPYAAQNYKSQLKYEKDKVVASETEPSLFKVVEDWLARTPGSNPRFWTAYKKAVHSYYSGVYSTKADAGDEISKAEWKKQVEVFDYIFDEAKFNQARKEGEFRMRHSAFQGALFIYLHRDEPRFHLPYTILTTLVDIDSLVTKFRYNHVMLVQRMIGSKMGTGGSSGYAYLRTTIGDRYKVFLDLFNLSTFLIPRQWIPELTIGDKKRLNSYTVKD